jgi:hypothetical protein
MITQLTKEQEALFPEYVKRFTELGLSTDRITLDEATEIVNNLYEDRKLKVPKKIELVDSPIAAIKLYAQYVGKKVKDCYSEISNFCWGAHEAGWVSFYAYMRDELKVPGTEVLNAYEKTLKLGWSLFYENLAIVSQKPTVLRRMNNVLHSTDKPAVEYADGYVLYRYKGLNMDNHTFAITNPESITVNIILKESNQEIKRALLEIYGYERFIEESGAKLIHSDKLNGSPVDLYRIEIGDVVIEGVLVINSTAEPDGEFKKYFIQVEPGKFDRAIAALASTFVRKDGTALTEEEYTKIKVET